MRREKEGKSGRTTCVASLSVCKRSTVEILPRSEAFGDEEESGNTLERETGEKLCEEEEGQLRITQLADKRGDVRWKPVPVDPVAPTLESSPTSLLNLTRKDNVAAIPIAKLSTPATVATFLIAG